MELCECAAQLNFDNLELKTNKEIHWMIRIFSDGGKKEQSREELRTGKRENLNFEMLKEERCESGGFSDGFFVSERVHTRSDFSKEIKTSSKSIKERNKSKLDALHYFHFLVFLVILLALIFCFFFGSLDDD